MSHDLAGLLAAGERAAFHGRPAAGIEPLQSAILVADEAGFATEAAAAHWLLGVCLASAGRYGSALEVLEPMLGAADTPEHKVLAALAGATVASVHRQLGRHTIAQGYDERALKDSDGQGEAGFDALLGLCTDAIGQNAAEVAEGWLQEAEALVAGGLDGWRQRVRLDWVRAEVALLSGRGEDAVIAAQAAVELAEHSGAPRHVAKGLLFQGVAELEAGRVTDAAVVLRRAGLLAESLGALPLVWTARAVLGALLSGEDQQESDRALASARRAAAAIAENLPPDLQLAWTARPDVQALMTSGS